MNNKNDSQLELLHKDLKGKFLCPDCGSCMVRRISKKDGNKFWGCSKFPKCTGIRDLLGTSQGLFHIKEPERRYFSCGNRNWLNNLANRDWYGSTDSIDLEGGTHGIDY